MTLSLAWVRDVANVQELVLATDSRLRTPFTWDCCPKLLPLPRNDCAVCFTGATYIAYPIMLQIQNALRLHPKSLSRAVDLYDFKGHVLEVINGMREFMHELPSSREATGESETLFILAGYSWRRSEFVIWTLHYDTSLDAFTFRPASPWGGIDGYRLTAVIGDGADEAKRRLTDLLRERGKVREGGLDMEPMAILRDMIRQRSNIYIGGAPQLIKIYRHMNCVPFGVYWPDRVSKRIAVFGRPLLDYEEPNCGVFDPDTFEIVPAKQAGAG